MTDSLGKPNKPVTQPVEAKMSNNINGKNMRSNDRQLLLDTAYAIVLRHKSFCPASWNEFRDEVRKMLTAGKIKTNFSNTELVEIYVGGSDDDPQQPRYERILKEVGGDQ